MIFSSRTLAAVVSLLGLAVASPAAAADPEEIRAERLEKTARAYLAVWELDGRAACEERRPACEHMEEILDRAARSFEAANRRSDAIVVWKILLEPRYHLSETAARNALHAIGAASEAMASYDEAATFYERFASTPAPTPAPTSARRSPDTDRAARALADAAVLRLRLGQDSQARDDVGLLQRRHGAAHPEVARITLMLASHHQEHEEWETARALLVGAMPAIDRGSPLERRLEAHTILARSFASLDGADRAADAATEYRKVLALAREHERDHDRAARAAKRDKQSPAPVPWSAAALDSRAEAHYYFAEQKRKVADRVLLPLYDGPGDRATILAYLETKAANWHLRKRWAIEEAERAYLKIFGIDLPSVPPPPPLPPPSPRPGAIGLLGGDPDAPIALWGVGVEGNPFSTEWDGAVTSPQWSIAAAARVGQLWGDFVRDIRSMPLLPSSSAWKGADGELRGAYFLTILDGPEAQKIRAKNAFAMCLRWSIVHRRFNAFSRSCEAWLSKNYRAEYRALEELHAWPAWTNAGVVARPAFPAWRFSP